MKCIHCKSSWNSSLIVANCPFCGKVINDNAEGTMDISTAIKKVIAEKGINIFNTPRFVVSYVMDCVQGYEREKNLLRMASANGLLEQAMKIYNEKSTSQREILVQRTKTKLMNDAFFAEEYAVLIINIVMCGIGFPELRIVDLKKEQLTEQKGNITHKNMETTIKEKSSAQYSVGDINSLISSNKRVSPEENRKIYLHGQNLLYKGNKIEAIKYIRFAAQHGNHDAAILLGDCYNSGNGVNKDWKVAEAYYRQAAVSGNHEAEYKLGYLLQQNYGSGANEWINKAAKAGYSPAIQYLYNRRRKFI